MTSDDALQKELDRLRREAENGARDPFDVIDEILGDLNRDLDASVMDNSGNLEQLSRLLDDEQSHGRSGDTGVGRHLS